MVRSAGPALGRPAGPEGAPHPAPQSPQTVGPRRSRRPHACTQLAPAPAQCSLNTAGGRLLAQGRRSSVTRRGVSGPPRRAAPAACGVAAPVAGAPRPCPSARQGVWREQSGVHTGGWYVIHAPLRRAGWRMGSRGVRAAAALWGGAACEGAACVPEPGRPHGALVRGPCAVSSMFRGCALLRSAKGGGGVQSCGGPGRGQGGGKEVQSASLLGRFPCT